MLSTDWAGRRKCQGFTSLTFGAGINNINSYGEAWVPWDCEGSASTQEHAHHTKWVFTLMYLYITYGTKYIAQWASPLDGGFSRKNIFCQKIFDNFFSFQATEMVLTSKWGRIQQEIQIWPDQVVAASWRRVRSPKHAEKMLIQLIMPTEPSSPAVQYSTVQYNTACWLSVFW